MDDQHPLTRAGVERGEGASKLDALRARLQTERVVNFFTSPAQLQAQVIHSLSQYRQPNLTDFHLVSDIPAYRLAWCDGPPFAYHWGLQQTKAHLAALNVPEPTLPPFDEPMPEVEINPSEEQETDE